MANPEHLGILKQGVEAWNRWRLAHHEINPDLGRAILLKADLQAADLSGANFYEADLRKTNFRGANLEGAYLRQADFSYTDLSGADLSNANLTLADFSGANLNGANLNSTNLMYTNLNGAKLHGADISFAKLYMTTLVNNDLTAIEGLDKVIHLGPSNISVDNIYRSLGSISDDFLRGAGIPEDLIEHIHSLTKAERSKQFSSCFISYSSKDQEFAERLHADLQAKGVRVWFAPHDLPIGARIRPSIDESIHLHDKLLLVLSEASVGSQWVEQEVETALAKEREQEGRTVLFPIRIDDAVIESKAGWPALLKNTRNVGDFTRWKDHDSYQKAFERLLRDLKTEEPAKSTYMAPDSLDNRAVLSPRNTFREGWKGVESSVIQAAMRNGLVSAGERVDCGLLINQLHEAGKVSETVREEYFLLSKWHRSVAFDSFSLVEPQTAINFVSRARGLQKALAVDTPPLR
jgi:hypothetical protein